MSSSNWCFLTCIQSSQEAGHVVWYSHLFKNFPEFVVIHTVKGFGIINKAEIDVFLELSYFFNGAFLLILSVNFWGKHILIYHLELWKQNLVKELPDSLELGTITKLFLDCKKIQSVNTKGNQSWIFIGRTDAEAETPKLWPPDAKNWLIGKDPDGGKDWRRKEKGATEDEMVG